MTIRFTTAVAISLPFLLAGCDMNVERTGSPLGNEAQESVDVLNPDPTAEDSAGSAGEVKQPGTDENVPPSPAEQAPDDARAQPPGQFGGNAPPIGEQQGTADPRPDEILNARELANDPNWTVAATDPAQLRGNTAPGTVRNRAVALAGSVDLIKWVQNEQALNGTWPSYQALKQYAEQNGADLHPLPPGKYYGYDETTGQIVILERKQ